MLEKPGLTAESMRYRMLNLGGDIDTGCSCELLWCDLDFVFDLAIGNLSVQILFRLYLRNCKV